MWQAVIAFQDYPFKTATGLPFRYKLKVGKNREYNRELLIDRREKSKSLAWSSVVLAFENSKRVSEEVKKSNKIYYEIKAIADELSKDYADNQVTQMLSMGIVRKL